MIFQTHAEYQEEQYLYYQDLLDRGKFYGDSEKAYLEEQRDFHLELYLCYSDTSFMKELGLSPHTD